MLTHTSLIGALLGEAWQRCQVSLWLDRMQPCELIRRLSDLLLRHHPKAGWNLHGWCLEWLSHSTQGKAWLASVHGLGLLPQPPRSRDTHGLFGIQCFLQLNNSIAYPSQCSFSYWFVRVSSKTSNILNGNKGSFYQATLKDTMQHQLPFRCNQTLWCGCSGPRATWWTNGDKVNPTSWLVAAKNWNKHYHKLPSSAHTAEKCHREENPLDKLLQHCDWAHKPWQLGSQHQFQ